MHRNYSEESSWGSLKEEEIDSEKGVAQTKILEQLKSPGSQQSLQNLDNREDDKATTGLNMRGKNSAERKVDQVKQKSIGPL